MVSSPRSAAVRAHHRSPCFHSRHKPTRRPRQQQSVIMVDLGSMTAVQALQKGLEDALRQLLASGAPSIQQQIVPTLEAALPQAMGSEVSALSRLQSSLVLPSLRSKCIQLTQEATAAQQPPLQYCLPGAAGPAIPRLMEVAIICQERKLLEATHVLQILEDVQDLVSVEHSLDIITWLEQHRVMLLSTYNKAQQQLIRLCNGIHKRLGKHDVIQRARLLMLTANCAGTFDRSGVNVTAAFAPADPPPVEEVPPDAVDSAGKPVDSTLYTAFWKLQPLIQEPIKVLKSASEWDNLQANLGTVLDGLARSKATVAAVHAAGSSALAAADAAAAADGSSELYLSSYKLFGLQLADSAFRRGFLVQVLILLRTLLLPGKQPTDTLKDKARMQAVALEGRVYKLLEETPHHGRELTQAVKEVLRRETTWVEWKKGKNLVLKGQPQVAPPAAAGGPKQPQQGCTSWELPELASLSAAVGQHQEKQQRESEKRKDTVRDGLQLKADIQDMSKQYDWHGATFIEVNKRLEPKDMLRFLGGAGESNVTYWAQQQVQDGTAMHPRPLMEGLKVAEQEKYPITERVCCQLAREMDPEINMKDDDGNEVVKRVVGDPVYRWRIGRAVAQEAPKYEGSLVTVEGLEEGMMEVQMPKSLQDILPQAFKDRYLAKKAEEEAKRAEEIARKKQKTGDGKAAGQPQQKPAAKPKAASAAAAAGGAEDPAAAGAAAAAAAAGGEDAEAAADGDAAAAVKQEQAEAEMAQADAAAAADAAEEDVAGTGGGGDAAAVKQEADETAAAAAAAAAAVVKAEEEEDADLAALAADGSMDVDQQGS